LECRQTDAFVAVIAIGKSLNAVVATIAAVTAVFAMAAHGCFDRW